MRGNERNSRGSYEKGGEETKGTFSKFFCLARRFMMLVTPF